MAPAAGAELLPSIPFHNVAAELGLDFRHDAGARGEKLLPETMGGGVALSDVDGDGDLDLLLANGAPFGPPASPFSGLALFRNDGGRFVEATRAAGLDVRGHAMAVLVADFDGDGWSDLLVTGVGRDWLWRGLGGRFEELAEPFSGRAGFSSGAACADLDGDGDLDLVVLRYLEWSPELDRGLDRQVAPGVLGYARPQQLSGTPPLLLLNQGGLRFTEEASERGLVVRDPQRGLLSKSLAVLPFDVEGDGDLDLFVANDTERNFLFENVGSGRFEEAGELFGVAWDEHGQTTGAMGVDVGDLGEGRWSIAVGNFAGEPSSLHTAGEDPTFFVDRATWSGVATRTRAPLAFAVLFADLDLDGRLDLLQVNGHLEPEVEALKPPQPYRQSPQLLWNAGGEGASFLIEMPASSVAELALPIVGRGAAYGDLGGDGDLDLVLTQIGGPVLLLRNDQEPGGRWLRLLLRGATPNREAIGATASLRTDSGRQRRFVQPSRGYLSTVERTLTFGLGGASPKVIELVWPRGRRQKLLGPPTDRTLVVDEAAVGPETGG